MKRPLPISIQDFAKLREGGCLYVDKTAVIHQLISGFEGAFFLSRPRRFGKSLLCSTLGAIFEGRRNLFGEIAGQPALAINSLEWEWKKHPVIRIDLNAGDYTEGIETLKLLLQNILENAAISLDLNLRGTLPSIQLGNLIMDAHRKYGARAVVIIDEYDKPLLNTIDMEELHVNIRKFLKGFYGVLKSSDAHLKFVFITGVSKFSHVSVFSDLNHLVDMTLDPKYADICGITQEELEQNFEIEIAEILKDKGKVSEEYFDELRRFYNGYRFSKKNLKVYNPFGLLKHFNSNGDFLTYWYETATPTFLLKHIENQKINILDLNNLVVGYSDFSKYDVETMRAAPLLYQTGYLTVSGYDSESNTFTLDYPNEEVRSCFAQSLLEHYTHASESAFRSLCTRLPIAFFNGDPETAMNILKLYLASIPYDIIKEKENYYQTAIYLIFTMLGLNSKPEVRIADGRIDTLLETKNYVYCFEFKLKGTADEALAQIDTKDYMLPWKESGKKLFKIGVAIDHEKRNIGEWKIMK